MEKERAKCHKWNVDFLDNIQRETIYLASWGNGILHAQVWLFASEIDKKPPDSTILVTQSRCTFIGEGLDFNIDKCLVVFLEYPHLLYHWFQRRYIVELA